jgi:hypothetical protein
MKLSPVHPRRMLCSQSLTQPRTPDQMESAQPGKAGFPSSHLPPREARHSDVRYPPAFRVPRLPTQTGTCTTFNPNLIPSITVGNLPPYLHLESPRHTSTTISMVPYHCCDLKKQSIILPYPTHHNRIKTRVSPKPKISSLALQSSNIAPPNPLP